MIVKIKNLRVRTLVGIFDWEQEKKQEITINIAIHFDGTKAEKTDDINDTIDYKTLRNQLVDYVEINSFSLIEKIAGDVANIILSHPLTERAIVEIDKPHVLRFSDSVSVIVDKEKNTQNTHE